MGLGNEYLILYNVLQTAGWAYMGVLLYPHLQTSLVEGKDKGELYAKVGFVVQVFQTAAALEILHAAVGLVRSNVVITTFQVFSRVFVTWLIVYAFPEARESRGYPLHLIAWIVTEVIRYSFYAFNLMGMNPYIIVWLRYTLFIILYPIGVTGELLCQYAALPVIARTARWSLSMPNAYNFVFNFHTVLICIMLSYIPIFPKLYLHMFAQRKKVVGGEGKKTR